MMEIKSRLDKIGVGWLGRKQNYTTVGTNSNLGQDLETSNGQNRSSLKKIMTHLHTSDLFALNILNNFITPFIWKMPREDEFRFFITKFVSFASSVVCCWKILKFKLLSWLLISDDLKWPLNQGSTHALKIGSQFRSITQKRNQGQFSVTLGYTKND